MTGRGRGGGTRLGRVDAVGGSTSQTGPSQTVDLTQYQLDYEVYEQAQAYHFEEPQPHQYQFDAYQQHQYEDHHEQPHIEQPQQKDDIDQPQQHDGGGRFQEMSRLVYEAGPTAMQGGLMSSYFYLTLVDMWHAGFGLMLM